MIRHALRWLNRPTGIDSRGQVQLVDVAMTFFVLVAILALAPTFFTFTDMAVGSADEFSGLLLRLVLPILLIALLISIGVSARRGGV